MYPQIKSECVESSNVRAKTDNHDHYRPDYGGEWIAI
jgi:hypothetical protein